MENVTIVGLNELNAKVNGLKKLFDGRELESVVLSGAKLIRDEYRRSVPRGPTGNLQRGAQAFRGRKASRFGAMAIAWINFKVAPHATWYELGTKPREGARGVMRIPLSKVGAVVGRARARVSGAFGYIFARNVKPAPAHHAFEAVVSAKVGAVQEIIEQGARKLIEGGIR